MLVENIHFMLFLLYFPRNLDQLKTSLIVLNVLGLKLFISALQMPKSCFKFNKNLSQQVTKLVFSSGFPNY